MDNWDWEKFGDDINRSVQDAVDSRDFSRLNQTISNTVNMAMDSFGRGMRDVGEAVNRSMRGGRVYGRRQDAYQYQGEEYAQDNTYQENRSKGQSTELQLYAKTGGSKVFGILFSVFGYGIVAIFLILLLITMAAAFVTGDFGIGAQIMLAISGILLIGGGVFTSIGRKRLGLVRRFQEYLQVLGHREYCDIKELSARIEKSSQYVVKDLQKMISRGWFKQGRLDEKKQCLMVSDSAYEQYLRMMDQMEQKRREEAEMAAKKAKEDDSMSPEVREIIRRGDEYIARIHASNDAIPGEEISAKISRMEMLVDRIFDRVEQNPESISDIRRMMDYYLPTTMKLLKAYEELDAQPVQGENILSSKKEIENTLDTLNLAFEKLLDSMFQDTAWDVSSDISVLHTMLAQEGLTKEDFKK